MTLSRRWTSAIVTLISAGGLVFLYYAPTVFSRRLGWSVFPGLLLPVVYGLAAIALAYVLCHAIGVITQGERFFTLVLAEKRRGTEIIRKKREIVTPLLSFLLGVGAIISLLTCLLFLTFSLLAVHRGFSPGELFALGGIVSGVRLFSALAGDPFAFGLLASANGVVAILLVARSPSWRTWDRWAFPVLVMPIVFMGPVQVIGAPPERIYPTLGSVTVLPDGTLREIGTEGGMLFVRDHPGPARSLGIPGSGAHINHSALSTDGRWLATSDYGGRIRVWDPVSSRQVAEAPPQGKSVHHISFVGSRLFWYRGGLIPFSFDPETRHAVALGPEVPFIHVSTHMGYSACEVSPDQELLAYLDCENKVRLIRTRTGAEVRSFEVDGLDRPDICFSRDSSFLALSAGRHRIIAFDVGKGTVWTREEGQRIRRLRFSPDGRTLMYVAGEDQLMAWSPASGQSVSCGKAVWYKPMVFSQDGQFLGIARSKDVLEVIRLPGGEVIQRWEGLSDVSAMAFTPDGREFVFGTKEGEVHRRPLGSALEEVDRVDKSVEAIVMSPEHGPMVLCDDFGCVSVWVLRRKARTFQTRGHEAFFAYYHSLSRDGARLACAGYGELRIVDVGDGRIVSTSRLEDRWPEIGYPNTNDRFCATGRQVAIDHCIYEVSTGTRIREHPEGSRIRWGPTDAFYAVVREGNVKTDDNEKNSRITTIHEFATGREVWKVEGDGSLTFSETGRFALVGREAKSHSFFRLADGALVKTVNWENLWYGNGVFSSDDGLFTWVEGGVQVVETSSWEPVASFSFPQKFGHLAISHDSRFLAGLTGDGLLTIVWDLGRKRRLGLIIHPPEEFALGLRFSPEGDRLHIHSRKSVSTYRLR